MQWHAHDTAHRKLDQYSVITVEDYQQNMEIVYGEMPTSTAYSGNKLTVVMFLLIFEYLDDNGNLCKAAYVFMLDDKKHDHQQVRAFEKKACELFRRDTGKTIKHWYRFTDRCGSQFLSQFVNGDMTTAKEDLTHLGFHYFEAHEGKNVSDAVGSIAKCAYMRAVSRGEVEGISSAKEAVNIINKNLKGKSPKFQFFKAVLFGSIERIAADERKGLEFDGIMATHSIVLRDDGLIADQLSCLVCTPAKLCNSCLEKDLVVEIEEEDALDEEIHEPLIDDGDIGQTDEEPDEDDTDDVAFNRGQIVWAKYGSKSYPAKIVGKEDVSEKYQKQLFSVNSDGFTVVHWHGENSYSRIKVSKIQILRESREDSKLADQPDILLKYNMALADLRDD